MSNCDKYTRFLRVQIIMQPLHFCSRCVCASSSSGHTAAVQCHTHSGWQDKKTKKRKKKRIILQKLCIIVIAWLWTIILYCSFQSFTEPKHNILTTLLFSQSPSSIRWAWSHSFQLLKLCVSLLWLGYIDLSHTLQEENLAFHL